jgi:predicted deacylase
MLGWTGVVLLAGELATPSARYDGHAVAAVEIASHDDLKTLEAMGLEIWTESPRPGLVHVRVPPDAWPALAASGFHVDITTADLGPVVEEENFRVTHDPAADHTDAFFDDYRELDEIYAHLDALVALRPDIASSIDVGTTLEGRSIRGIEITSPDPEAPVILIDAGQHAREWISMATATCIADELVTHADDPEIDSLLSQLTFVIVPVVNPDGFAYTFTDDRFWRKNRRDGFGVDTNRNFGVAWGGPGASDEPEAGNYHGESAFSEPETAALRDLAMSYDNLKSHVDLHSFGQLVLFPWGYTEELAPAHDTLSTVASDMTEAMDEVGATYTPLMGTMLYPAAGNATDWFYGELGAYAFTYELRPAEAEEHDLGFVLPAEEIRDVCLEAMAGITVLAEFTIAAAPGEPGDDGNADTDGWGTTDTTGVEPMSGTDTEAADTSSDDTSSGGSSTSGGVPSSSTSGIATTTAAGESTGDGAATDARNGCGCGSGRGAGPLALMCLALVLRRRRR